MADNGAKPTVVFLHGWTMEGCIFDDVIERLSDRLDCHAPDLPGHGSHESDFPLTMDGFADFLRAYLHNHGIKRPFLVGWSLGATVAWNLMRRFPDIEFAGLVVIDMSPKTINDDKWMFGIRKLAADKNENLLSSMEADWRLYAERINADMYAQGPQQQHPRTLDIILRQNPRAMIDIWKALSGSDERDTLGRLRCPTLVITGAKGRIYPAETAQFISKIAPDCEIAVFEKSGHSVPLEEPDRFARVLITWIDRMGGEGTHRQPAMSHEP